MENDSNSYLFEINTILFTKDGRYFGNAIIIGRDDKYNVIKTDYGNEVKLTDDDIIKYFYIANSKFSDLITKMSGKHKYSVKIIE